MHKWPPFLRSGCACRDPTLRKARKDSLYGKTFKKLWDGSLGRQFPAWAVFVFMFSNCDSEGVFEMDPEQIALRTGMQLDDVHRSILALEAPDPRSRTPDHEGRRIARLEGSAWTWLVLNYPKYRSMKDMDSEKEKNRERARRYRERHSNGPSRRVTPSNAVSRQAEAEAEAEAEADKPNPLVHPASPSEPVGGGEETPAQWKEGFPDFWADYPRKVARAAAEKAYMKLKPRTQETYDLLFSGLRVWKREWEGRDMDKVPHASTWLNQRRYLDAQENR